jgi:hypothetical protein
MNLPTLASRRLSELCVDVVELFWSYEGRDRFQPFTPTYSRYEFNRATMAGCLYDHLQAMSVAELLDLLNDTVARESLLDFAQAIVLKYSTPVPLDPTNHYLNRQVHWGMTRGCLEAGSEQLGRALIWNFINDEFIRQLYLADENTRREEYRRNDLMIPAM